MTESNRRFTTDSSPGEQIFERTAKDTTTYIAELLGSESEYWGPQMHAIIRASVRASLRADGRATAENVERLIRNDDGEILGESFGPDNRADVLERFDGTLRGNGGNGETGP